MQEWNFSHPRPPRGGSSRKAGNMMGPELSEGAEISCFVKCKRQEGGGVLNLNAPNNLAKNNEFKNSKLYEIIL